MKPTCCVNTNTNENNFQTCADPCLLPGQARPYKINYSR